MDEANNLGFDDATLKEKKIDSKEISVKEYLASGNFGQVHKGSMKLPDGSTIDIAIKAPKLCHLTESALVDFYKEAKTTFSLKHDNIVKCLGFSKKPNELPSLLFEFMTYGSLDKILDSNRTKKFQTSCLPKLSYSHLWKFCLDISEGMEYMEKNRIVHRDLAARNCLVNSQLQVKISDFGMTRVLMGSSEYYKMGCDSLLPVRWMAPESLRYTTFSSASDAWSFGVTIWEIYTLGEKPYFLQISNEDVCQKIVDGWTLDPPEQCPEIIKNIMKQCWNYQPNERYTFEDIVSMIKNSDSEHTKTLPISQTNENDTKSDYVSFETLTNANTPMRSPDNNLEGTINSFNLGLSEEPSGTKWGKLPLLAISVLLVFTCIGAGIAISLSSQNQGMEPEKFLGPRCLTTSNDDSPDKNAECKFPWKFEGKVINGCTDASTPDGKYWCSTKVDDNLERIKGQGNWGFCRQSCPTVALDTTTLRPTITTASEVYEAGSRGCEKSNLITSTWRKEGKFWSAGRSTFKISDARFRLRWTIGLTFDKEIIALVDNNVHTNCNGKTCTVENKYYKPDEGHKVTLKYRVVYQSKPKPQVTRLTLDGIEICAVENLECIESDKYLLIKCDQQRSHIISNNGIHGGQP